jgi:ABC-type phosphate transport system substrate-binding protein
MNPDIEYHPLSQSEPSIQDIDGVAKRGPLKRPICQGRSNITLRTWLEAGVILLIGILASLAAWYMIGQFQPQAVPVIGYGTSFSNLFLTKMLETYIDETPKGQTYPIYYTNENMPDFDRIINGSTNFVAFDDVDQPVSQYEGLLPFPVVAASLVPIVHFLDDLPNPPIVEKFTLTRDHLVGIYNGTFTRFCNISTLNPIWNEWICLKETQNLTAWHREEASGTNFIFTSALASFSSEWRHAYPPGLKTKWPIGIGRSTTSSNSLMISSVALTPWSIGYLPVPDFKNFVREKGTVSVHPIDIWNPTRDGLGHRSVSAMEPNSLKAAVDFSAALHSTTAWNQSLIDLPCEDCWPIAGYAHMLLREDYSKNLGYNSLTSIVQMVKFFEYILNEGVQYGVSVLSYASPPKPIIELAKLELLKVRFHGQLLQKIYVVKYDIMAVGIIVGVALIGAIMRMTIPLCMKPKSQDGRPMSRVKRDEIFDEGEGSHHSLMRQILENDAMITSTKQPRMEDSLRKALIDTGELVIQKQIGKGAAGDVFMGTYIGAIVAIKRMLLPTNSERLAVVETFVREASTMSLLRHPNIVQFLGASVSPPYLYLITEYCTQGSLYDVIHGHNNPPGSSEGFGRNSKRNFSKIGKSQKCAFLIDAALGIMYLHGKGIVHRDIKTHNLLVDRTGTVKVADFGTSTVLGFNVRATGSENNMKTMVGTPEYVAPEVVTPKGNGYSYKADIYSFGIVAWEVWSGQQPYKDLAMIDILFGVTTTDIRPPIEAIDEPELAIIIQRCWAKDPDQRPTFEEILNVLRDIDDDSD